MLAEYKKNKFNFKIIKFKKISLSHQELEYLINDSKKNFIFCLILSLLQLLSFRLIKFDIIIKD